MEITLKELEVQKLNLQPGEVLAVTIKSDDVDATILNALKQGFAEAFPGVKVLLFGLGLHDEMKFTVIKEINENNACNSTNFCADCTCGKKELNNV